MRTLEAIAISKTIVDNVNESKAQLIKEMTKNGFVNVDGIIKQYNPRTYEFINASSDDLKDFFNSCIKNKWGIISFNQIIEDLKLQLPQLSSSEIANFTAYIQQYEVEINTELIETRLNEVLNDYKQFENIKVTINGGRDITNQLIVMKQNNIFVDIKSRYIYKFKDSEFQIYNLNDIMGLLNSYLTSEDNPVKNSDVQRNKKIYLESLTDIHDIRMELGKKQQRDDTLRTYEDDYKKILKLIKNY